MIICFEGPSAIGKTRLSQSLADDFCIVPEVNLLFEQENSPSKFWYYEKQVERHRICQSSNKTSILDGDTFQPIWYNWIYGYPPEFLGKEETHEFYRRKLINKDIAYPDLYIIFQVEREELIRRKENDSTRKRRNFAKHLAYISPQRRYFHFLKNHTDIQVEFVDYTNFEEARMKVCKLIENNSPQERDAIGAFGKINDWLENERGKI